MYPVSCFDKRNTHLWLYIDFYLDFDTFLIIYASTDNIIYIYMYLRIPVKWPQLILHFPYVMFLFEITSFSTEPSSSIILVLFRLPRMNSIGDCFKVSISMSSWKIVPFSLSTTSINVLGISSFLERVFRRSSIALKAWKKKWKNNILIIFWYSTNRAEKKIEIEDFYLNS